MNRNTEDSKKFRAKRPTYHRDWMRRNSTEVNAKKRKRRNTEEGRIATLYEKVKLRQSDTDIDREWIEQRVKHGLCCLTGLPFKYGVKEGHRNPYTPSIDRVDSSKGYFKDNCMVILCWLNIAKQDMSIAIFKQLLQEAAGNIEKVV